MTRQFIHGLDLCRQFYEEAIQPILSAHFPDLAYDAALIGKGSDVQGFDDLISTDHGWGPRLQIFTSEKVMIDDIHSVLANNLPHRFMGYSTGFIRDEADGSYIADDRSEGLVKHLVTVTTVADYVREWLAADLPLSAVEWVVCGDQSLRSLTRGEVYHAGLGTLSAAREQLDYYPYDVWLYLMAGTWGRIGQEEHLLGRAGSRGDEVGAALIASRLVRDIMRLAFLMEKQYAPYPKWFGTSFAQLDSARVLLPHLKAVLASVTWQERDHHMAAAYEHMSTLHNALGVTDPIPEKVTLFHNRPFKVIWGGTIAETIHVAISDPAVKALPPTLGGIDTISNSTDVLSYPEVRARARAIWRE